MTSRKTTASGLSRGRQREHTVSCDFEDGLARIRLKDLTTLLGYGAYETAGRLFRKDGGTVLLKRPGSLHLWLTAEQVTAVIADERDVLDANKLMRNDGRDYQRVREIQAVQRAVGAWFAAAAREATTTAETACLTA